LLLPGKSPALGCGYKLLVDFGGGASVTMNLTTDGRPPVAGCSTNYPASGPGLVFSNYQVSDLAPGADNWYILGLPFLRQFYTVFDFDRLRIGFYQSVQG
jgi:hypothetical protein